LTWTKTVQNGLDSHMLSLSETSCKPGPELTSLEAVGD